MTLPEAGSAEVSEAKIVGYLLNRHHPAGRSKVAFFLGHGFSPDRWMDFANALRLHASEHEVIEVDVTPFGTIDCVEGSLRTPGGRLPSVRSV